MIFSFPKIQDGRDEISEGNYMFLLYIHICRETMLLIMTHEMVTAYKNIDYYIIEK